jgi:hypothetical protein
LLLFVKLFNLLLQNGRSFRGDRVPHPTRG